MHREVIPANEVKSFSVYNNDIHLLILNLASFLLSFSLKPFSRKIWILFLGFEVPCSNLNIILVVVSCKENA